MKLTDLSAGDQEKIKVILKKNKAKDLEWYCSFSNYNVNRVLTHYIIGCFVTFEDGKVIKFQNEVSELGGISEEGTHRKGTGVKYKEVSDAIIEDTRYAATSEDLRMLEALYPILVKNLDMK